MSPRRPAVLRHGGGDPTLREHLIATAARLIAEQGTALTVREIAREAKVADGVLYNHFDGKEELLAHALHQHVKTVMDGLGSRPSAGEGDIGENLRVYITNGLDVLARILPAFAGLVNQPKILPRFAAIHDPSVEMQRGGLRAALAEYLRAEQQLGRIDRESSVDAAATMIMGACHELVLPRLFQGSPASELDVPPDFVDDLVTTVLHGIIAERPEP